MRRGGSSSSAANAGGGGGGGLAIAERQKPAPSRVAALFQMLARRKLFSSSSSKKTKLLAPVREQRFLSPGRPPDAGAGAGEKTPVAKKRPLLLDSADYARSKSESHGTSRLPPPSQDSNSSEMCNPGVVARLMGLSSMPAISHERSARAADSCEPEVAGHRNEHSQGLPGSSGSMAASHQKPGQVMDGWHDNAGKFSADSQALWSGRHQSHKVASPLKSPRSISSRNKARLIEAAARVLEPGLQSRNRHRNQRHARLEYPCNGDGVATTAAPAAAIHNSPDQFSREMGDVDAPMSGAGNVGAASLHNSAPRQWSEEKCKKIAADRKPNQNVPWQGQPGGNIKVLPVSNSSEKARVKESDAVIFNATADTYQDARKVQPRSVSRGNVASGPLKQNNLKQNALPTVPRTEDPQHMIQRQKHRSGEQSASSTGKDFVSLNKSMNSSASLRSKGKVMDEIRLPRSNAQNKNLSTKGHRTSGLRSDSSNKPKPRTASPKAMEKDMIIAKGAGLVSEKPKTASANHARNDLLRPVEPRNASRCNDSDIVSFTFSSPMKATPTSLPSKNTGAVLGSANGPKRNSHRDCQSISSERELGFREKLRGTSSMDGAESVWFNRDELKNRDIPGSRGRVTASWSEKASDVPVLRRSSSEELLRELDSLMHVFGELPNSVELRETHKKPEPNRKANDTSRSVPGGNRQRGRLRPTYADENCTSGNSNYTKEAQLEDRRLSETCAPPSSARDATTERNVRRAEPNSGQHGAHRLAPAVQGSKPAPPAREVTSTVDLLLTSACSSGLRNSKEAFLLRTSESVLATLTPRSSGNNNSRPKASGANPLRSLASDLVTECLDSMCAELCDSGYTQFTRLAATARTEQRLAVEVRREAARRGDMAGQDLGDLAAGDVERAAAAGVAREAFRIGALIERDLVHELVHEVGLDMLRAAAVNL
ncbi:uncharacterized protein LOC119349374 [Triticum dicoccoides]|uniref:uncharacterized protein LOC119349374 n=1 Tax=Triticum dicoccoides TaxID=85692 RepID=UPI00189070FB|nr:uncharacterized protein LOC119349374 [Triticum dicoccoides]